MIFTLILIQPEDKERWGNGVAGFACRITTSLGICIDGTGYNIAMIYIVAFNKSICTNTAKNTKTNPITILVTYLMK